MAFATVEDVAARLGRPIADSETPRFQALLDDVSALIADYCTANNWTMDSPPATFKAVAAAEAIRWSAVDPGVVLERTGEMETQYGVTASNNELSQAARNSLSKYRLKATTISVRETQCPPE
ncbi:hypothetical protein [Streptomyces sp. CBMA29]|uniref:hypothetical protein n=1 Tax=Streptomyces sp. CBMA29 TaxID=1896314 RepID=UPI001662179E|nr:hypothetical protein [Streptomyces sp. CBMA29]MBD0739843.1 hypothetical protein [Streptomyces sp. CBMA29]